MKIVTRRSKVLELGLEGQETGRSIHHTKPDLLGEFGYPAMGLIECGGEVHQHRQNDQSWAFYRALRCPLIQCLETVLTQFPAKLKPRIAFCKTIKKFL